MMQHHTRRSELPILHPVGNGLRRLVAVTALTTAMAWSATAIATPVDRLIIAVEPPAVDTSLYWTSASDISLFPALGRLIGNDAVTGEYSNDGLAERWEANEDFTEWTFYLHQSGYPFH
jgi:ABC-type transport system substrate-binding protein